MKQSKDYKNPSIEVINLTMEQEVFATSATLTPTDMNYGGGAFGGVSSSVESNRSFDLFEKDEETSTESDSFFNN